MSLFADYFTGRLGTGAYVMVAALGLGLFCVAAGLCLVPTRSEVPAWNRNTMWSLIAQHRPRPLYSRRRRKGRPLPDLGLWNDICFNWQQFWAHGFGRKLRDNWFGVLVVSLFVAAVISIVVLSGITGVGGSIFRLGVYR